MRMAVGASDMAGVSDREFIAVYDKYYDRIRGFIMASVRDQWLAEDITQDTFLKARRQIDFLRDPDKIKSWLFRIAYNCCQDHFRSATIKQNHASSMVQQTPLDHFPAMEKQMEQQQMSSCVRKLVQRLPETYRTVLWLFDILGFSQGEIATALGIEQGNVKIRLHRARKKMKTLLESNCRFERDEYDIFVCMPKADGAVFL